MTPAITHVTGALARVLGLTCIAVIGGCRPAAPPAGALQPGEPWFEEVAAARGLHFTHRSGHRDLHLFPEIMVGGAALFDMDGDGDLDAYLVQSGSLVDLPSERPGNKLFRNCGDGRFEDVTAGSGADDRGYGAGVTAGDYDNDGDLDLYVTNVGPNVLLRNEGGGRFTDVTEGAGVGDPGWGSSAAFLDFDRDGDLDLFVVNYIQWSIASDMRCETPAQGPDYCGPKGYSSPAPSVLYRNNGNGTFTDVSVAFGLRSVFGNGLGIVCGDFDGDGWVDVFVANDGAMNQLWLNQRGERFEDAAMLRGCALDEAGLAKAGMGVCAPDFDDDGDLDLVVVNLEHESDSFYENSGDFFRDRTIAVGLATVSRPFTRFGLGTLDLDNDGWLDLYVANGRVGLSATRYSADPYAEPNLLFRGTPARKFEEVQPRGGTTEPLIATSRAAAFGDIDNDGGMDVLVANRDGPAHLLHNVAKNRGHWIAFRVVEEHGRDAFGASVTLRAAGRRLRRDVWAAYSYCASNDPRVHFGLGDTTTVEDVTVVWPDGETQTFGSFRADQIITLTRDASAN